MRFYYVTPLLRGERLFGLWWQRADGRWDTIHRVRLGLGPVILELAWPAKKDCHLPKSRMRGVDIVDGEYRRATPSGPVLMEFHHRPETRR